MKKHFAASLTALVTALLLALGCMGALAANGVPEVLFSLTWNENGVMMQSNAAPLAGSPDSYWLYVPQGALQNDATLSVYDTTGRYAYFSLANGTPLSAVGYLDAGSQANGNALPVLAYDASYQLIGQFNLYISTVTDAPLPPAQPDSTVMVYYVDQNYNSIASPTTVEVPYGQRVTVTPSAWDIPAGYTLQGSSQQNVSYTDSAIYFVYAAPQNTFVTVYYVDQNYNSIASPTTVE
ncbi:MAG: MucBP domain-containing protein, partial [Clostridia bacterium]|nr:MucBP domain-containing protein [Clostridia bacterium]